MYNMVAIVDKTILYNWNLLKVELNYSYQKKKKLIYEVINMLINSIVGVLSQCILILKYFVHFRYIINLSVISQ